MATYDTETMIRYPNGYSCDTTSLAPACIPIRRAFGVLYKKQTVSRPTLVNTGLCDSTGVLEGRLVITTQ